MIHLTDKTLRTCKIKPILIYDVEDLKQAMRGTMIDIHSKAFSDKLISMDVNSESNEFILIQRKGDGEDYLIGNEIPFLQKYKAIILSLEADNKELREEVQILRSQTEQRIES